jgi:hypothetical protein
MTPEGSKELFIGLKTELKIPSLGIKIQNCM